MKSAKFKGYLLAALAAAAYGTNPAFAVPLYDDGMNPNSVLLFRYLLGLLFLSIIMIARGTGFRLQKSQLWHSMILGFLMAFSSLSLFESYRYINSGVASTLLFVYPIMVAVIMTFFFKEKFKISIALCLLIMTVGLIMLMHPQQGATLNPYGCLLVLVSALTYALYIILVNVSKAVSSIPATKLLFYVLVWGTLVFLLMIPAGAGMTLPSKNVGWINLAALAIIPTVISLICTTRAIQLIGSTPTAILGALEPVSAVILSIAVLHQAITTRDILGGTLIIIATTIVIAGNSIDRLILHMRKMLPTSKQKP